MVDKSVSATADKSLQFTPICWVTFLVPTIDANWSECGHNWRQGGAKPSGSDDKFLLLN